ncbi:MAG: hypothetical protein WCK64_05980 [Synechococcaceae cyanobacterium ELA445]
MTEPPDQERVRFSFTLPIGIIEKLNLLQKEWGLLNRGALFERLLEMVFEGDSDTSDRGHLSFSLQMETIERFNLLQEKWGLPDRHALFERLLEKALEGDPDISIEEEAAYQTSEK